MSGSATYRTSTAVFVHPPSAPEEDSRLAAAENEHQTEIQKSIA